MPEPCVVFVFRASDVPDCTGQHPPVVTLAAVPAVAASVPPHWDASYVALSRFGFSPEDRDALARQLRALANLISKSVESLEPEEPPDVDEIHTPVP